MDQDESFYLMDVRFFGGMTDVFKLGGFPYKVE
jgi:hypothetical protein